MVCYLMWVGRTRGTPRMWGFPQYLSPREPWAHWGDRPQALRPPLNKQYTLKYMNLPSPKLLNAIYTLRGRRAKRRLHEEAMALTGFTTTQRGRGRNTAGSAGHRDAAYPLKNRLPPI